MRIPLQKPAFDAALTRYLEAVGRERRRERLARWKLAAVLTCALLVCGWPYSQAADATGDRFDRVALFARPELRYVSVQLNPAQLELQRLAFAGALGEGPAPQLPAFVVAATGK